MSDVIAKVRQALGRTRPMDQPPTPPVIDESLARLVARDANLVDRFIQSATAAHLHVARISPDQAAAAIAQFCVERKIATVGLPISPLLDRLGIARQLQNFNIAIKQWNELTLDAVYDLDCGVTDVFAAVAETGSLVIRPTPGHGRALSLVPPVHIAVVEPGQIMPDLIDVMARLCSDGASPNITFITGPSKTADIEGILITGVHGPGLVQVFLLDPSPASPT